MIALLLLLGTASVYGEDEDMNEISEETDLRPLSHEELKHMVMRRINRSTGKAQSINPTLVKDANTQRSPRIPKVEVIQPK